MPWSMWPKALGSSYSLTCLLPFKLCALVSLLSIPPVFGSRYVNTAVLLDGISTPLPSGAGIKDVDLGDSD